MGRNSLHNKIDILFINTSMTHNLVDSVLIVVKDAINVSAIDKITVAIIYVLVI